MTHHIIKKFEERWSNLELTEYLGKGWKVTLWDNKIECFDPLHKRYKKIIGSKKPLLNALYGTVWPEKSIYDVEEYFLFKTENGNEKYFPKTGEWENA